MADQPPQPFRVMECSLREFLIINIVGDPCFTGEVIPQGRTLELPPAGDVGVPGDLGRLQALLVSFYELVEELKGAVSLSRNVELDYNYS